MRILPLLLATLLGACATASPQPARSQLQLVDRAHEFDELLTPLAGQPVDQQWAAIQKHFATALPGFYDFERFGDQRDFVRGIMMKKLESWPADRAAAVRVADNFASMFAPAVRDFERAVGPLPADEPIYLVMSLGEFDGGSRTIAGREYLFFAADGIAQYQGQNNPRTFLHHELFHLYHSPRFGDCKGLWCSLWQEGLAVHASAVLNPGATDAELGLVLPEPIRPKVEANKAEAACAMIARLDSEGWDNYGPIFSGGKPLSPNLPSRFGYLLGQWVATDLGKGKSLTEMAEWKGPELRAKVEASLRRMASCP